MEDDGCHRRAGGLHPSALYFAAGQTCFAAADHQVALERNEIYVARAGDWRGNPEPGNIRRHSRAEHWVEEFAEHQDWPKSIKERG